MGQASAFPPRSWTLPYKRDLVDAGTPYFSGHTLTRMWRTAPEQRYGYLAQDQPANLVLLNSGGLYRNLRQRVPDQVYRTGHRVVALHGQRNGPKGEPTKDSPFAGCCFVRIQTENGVLVAGERPGNEIHNARPGESLP